MTKIRPQGAAPDLVNVSRLKTHFARDLGAGPASSSKFVNMKQVYFLELSIHMSLSSLRPFLFRGVSHIVELRSSKKMPSIVAGRIVAGVANQQIGAQVVNKGLVHNPCHKQLLAARNWNASVTVRVPVVRPFKTFIRIVLQSRFQKKFQPVYWVSFRQMGDGAATHRTEFLPLIYGLKFDAALPVLANARIVSRRHRRPSFGQWCRGVSADNRSASFILPQISTSGDTNLEVTA
jgi:hypothetical protein